MLYLFISAFFFFLAWREWEREDSLVEGMSEVGAIMFGVIGCLFLFGFAHYMYIGWNLEAYYAPSDSYYGEGLSYTEGATTHQEFCKTCTMTRDYIIHRRLSHKIIEVLKPILTVSFLAMLGYYAYYLGERWHIFGRRR